MAARKATLPALTVEEKAGLLDELLAAHPQLRGEAEERAAARLAAVDTDDVAERVASTLGGLAMEELAGRAGYRPGVGYVHEGEAAAEILDEALEPFLADLRRRARLGHAAAVTQLAVGILIGLYECRHPAGETLLEYAPDYAYDRAWALLRECDRLGAQLPVDDLAHVTPAWDGLIAQAGR